LRKLEGLDEESLEKLEAIRTPGVREFVLRYLSLCQPESVFVCTGTEEDQEFIRREALASGEERALATPGHTLHFDGYYDQGRDRDKTKFLLAEPSPHLPSLPREEGLAEIHELLRGSMRGHRMYVLFFVLGPRGFRYQIPCVQLTDSSYVAHTESLLYRHAYDLFKRRRFPWFFRFVHSQGELEGGVSKNVEKKRIYIDLEGETVFSVNTQYGGNSIGLKKLAMRLAIRRGHAEGWLTEHMFIMGVHGPGERVTYFAGAFPSMCGKTSTCMLEGETIVGDDIAILWRERGRVRAVNTEKGIFGILDGINSADDPVLWRVLHRPCEMIFSNVLLTEDGGVYWNGMDGDPPSRGTNYAGEWFPGKRGPDGHPVPPSHKNARFAVSLENVENADPLWDDPAGVEVGGIIFGGRDSDTWAPVEEAFDWVHGVVTKGASLESETTAATLGREGVRELNPMANLDFLSIPLGEYLARYLEFGKGLSSPPKIFSVNYFLRDERGEFLTTKKDKAVWLKWMELRVHGNVGALEAPTGLLPRYEDLRDLFGRVLGRRYGRSQYLRQFSVRIPQHLSKLERVEAFYRKIPGVPTLFFEVLEAQRRRLEEARKKWGDLLSPQHLPVREA